MEITSGKNNDNQYEYIHVDNNSLSLTGGPSGDSSNSTFHIGVRLGLSSSSSSDNMLLDVPYSSSHDTGHMWSSV